MSQPIEFFFDPVCPFCWMTSKWVRQVERIEDLDVTWRFISLDILNEDRERSEMYRRSHQVGLRLLRVADAVGREEGNAAVGRFYLEVGSRIWETVPDVLADGPPPPEKRGEISTSHREEVAAEVDSVLREIGVSPRLAGAAEEEGRDAGLRKSTEEALDRTGGNVGTPILTFEPPDGPSFFGPVISINPTDQQAVELWEAVQTLAHWPSFAELKRSLRTTPQTAFQKALTGL